MISNEIFEFDVAAMPFRELLVGICRDFVFERYAARLERLEDLHRFVPESDIAALYAAVYRFLGKPAFKTAYARLGRFVVDNHFGGRAAFQGIPSVRIHLVNQKSVQYHTDEWYGHGRDVVNYWLPLVPVSGTNSMFVTEPGESDELTELFERGQLSMQEMNDCMRRKSQPLDMHFGQIFKFSSRLMHGSELNDTDTTRVSFDFRILPDGADRGVKSETFFVRPDDYEAALQQVENRGATKPRIGIVYINVNEGFTRFVSQKNQQLLAHKYAEDCGISVLTAETEIVTMSHYPMLFDLLAGGTGRDCDVLLLFSVLLLPRTDRDRRRVFQLARERNLELRFVVEDVCFPANGTEQDERRILQMRGQLLEHAA